MFLIYVYTALILMQLALFNVIIVGVAIVYGNRWVHFLYALEHRQNYNFKTRPFKRFIEAENERYFRKEKCELIGGEMGRWIELQLPEDIEEMRKTEDLSQRLKLDALKVINEWK